MPMTSREDVHVHAISIVVPVYQGELTLEPLLAEIEPLTISQSTPGGVQFCVSEVMLVHDGAIDDSDAVMSSLAVRLPFVTPIWLSRNFGQHPATLAGMSSTNGDWVVTLDEDGQHDPRDIIQMLDVAVKNDAQLVYAQPTNAPPHGWVRNFFSALVSGYSRIFWVTRTCGEFNSFRLIRERLLAVWQLTVGMASTSTSLCPGLWPEEPSARFYYAPSEGVLRATLSACSPTTSGIDTHLRYGALRFVAFIGIARFC